MFLLFIILLSEIEECERKKFPQKVVVFEFEGISKEVDEITPTLSALFRSEFKRCPRYKVVSKGIMKEVLGEENLVPKDREDLLKKCSMLKARFGIEGKVLKLGNKIIITVNLIDTVIKGEVFGERVTSASLEDLDLVIRRLATAVCLQQKIETQVTVKNITEEEAKPKRRRQTYHLGGIKMGVLFPIGGSYGKKREWNYDNYEKKKEEEEIKRLLGMTFCYAFELPMWMVKLEWKVYSNVPASYTGIMISLYRFNSVTDFSFFIKGGAGLGWASMVMKKEQFYEIESISGMNLEIGGGMVMFRTYDFHILGEIVYNVILEKNFPHGILLNFGVLYKKIGAEGCFF
jgi:TolB-like protein